MLAYVVPMLALCGPFADQGSGRGGSEAGASVGQIWARVGWRQVGTGRWQGQRGAQTRTEASVTPFRARLRSKTEDGGLFVERVDELDGREWRTPGSTLGPFQLQNPPSVSALPFNIHGARQPASGFS